MHFRRTLLVGTSALALNAALTGVAVLLTPEPAQASCLTVSGDTIISDSSAACITWNSSNISITSGGTVTGSVTGIANSGNIVGVLTNDGSIGGSGIGVFNDTGSSIAAITNNSGGVIHGTSHSGIQNAGTIGTITNSGD